MPHKTNSEQKSKDDPRVDHLSTVLSTSGRNLVTYEAIPGRIELVLKEPSPAGNSELALDETASDLAGEPHELLQRILSRHNLIRFEPSSAASPPSFSEAAHSVESLGTAKGKKFTLHFPEDADLGAIIGELGTLAHVDRAVPVPKLFPPSEPTTETLIGTTDVIENPPNMLDNQWYIYRSRVDRAWRQGISGKGVIVAVIDWGFRTSHQDFFSRIELTHNSINNDEDVTKGPKIRHGTAVLGQVGAGVNGIGLAGIAYEATLWAIQAGTTPETTKPEHWRDAIKFVCDQPGGDKRKVILLEVETDKGGNVEMVSEINSAIREAIAKNVVVCIPAGNGDRDVEVDLNGTRIDSSGAILVGATGYDRVNNARAKFIGNSASNWGRRVAVAAPGDENHDITCDSELDNKYTNQFGKTSGAAAKVAGVIALMLQANPALTHEDVSTILASGVPAISEVDKPVGAFLDAELAVREALNRRNRNN